MKIDKLLTKNQILWLTHIGALIPLAWLLYEDYTPLAWLLSEDYTNGLSVNPIQDWTLRTGKPALVLLVLSLACTPLNIVLGWRNIIPARKWLGLYAFSYAAIHFYIFIGEDYGFQWTYIWQDVGTKLYIIVGFSALLILLPLALTSSKAWMRRLGRLWKKLHQWVYVAGVLAVFHYVWVVKADYREPAAWGVLLGFFLLVRIPVVRKRIARLRSKPRSPSGPKARRSPA
jgi:sulfoxide reductase heme-binding subunit YedZ